MKPNKKALKRSFWGSLGRLIGVMMAAGSGTLLSKFIGPVSSLNIPLAVVLTVAGFLCIWFAEYERETEP